MTIHHDKSAYGRLRGGSEVMSEEKLMEIIASVNDAAETECKGEDADDSCSGVKNSDNTKIEGERKKERSPK